MDLDLAIKILISLILFCLSAFFSSSETALTAVNKVRIRTLADEGDEKALTVEKLLEQQPRVLSALLIGNNIANTVLTAMVTLTVTEVFGSVLVGLATAILTVLLIVLGEITPKNIAQAKAEEYSLRVAGPVYRWMILITPVSVILNLIVKLLMLMLGVDPDQRDSYTESEIRIIVDESHEGGEIEAEEKEMINNVFDLGESCAKDLMVPRAHMVFVPVDATYEETLAVFRESLFTRLPVYEGDSFNVVGILNVKDLLIRDPASEFSVASLMREANFTHEFKKTSELMKEMLDKGITIMIVLDEYGDTSGLITMEDLLEEIVGEIRDEYDDEKEEDPIEVLGEGVYLVDASINLSELNDRIEGLNLASEEFDSLGGVVIELLDRLPVEGDEVETIDGVTLSVKGVDQNHIDKIELRLPKHQI